jgi:hypothetical protein
LVPLIAVDEAMLSTVLKLLMSPSIRSSVGEPASWLSTSQELPTHT